MPYLSIQTNLTLTAEQQAALLHDASRLVANLLDKPQDYVMVAVLPCAAMSFAGSGAPCAYLELKSIALPEDRTAAFSDALCSFITQHLDIPAARVYIEFSNPRGQLWGWDRMTF